MQQRVLSNRHRWGTPPHSGVLPRVTYLDPQGLLKAACRDSIQLLRLDVLLICYP